MPLSPDEVARLTKPPLTRDGELGLRVLDYYAAEQAASAGQSERVKYLLYPYQDKYLEQKQKTRKTEAAQTGTRGRAAGPAAEIKGCRSFSRFGHTSTLYTAAREGWTLDTCDPEVSNR